MEPMAPGSRHRGGGRRSAGAHVARRHEAHAALAQTGATREARAGVVARAQEGGPRARGARRLFELPAGTPSTSTDVDKLADTPFASDAAAPNGSSIALLAEFGGASVLLGADAHAPVLVESVRKLLRQRGVDRLRLDAFKVSHHASQNNLSTELLQLLDCKTYGVSTNGDHFCHPDREAIARIIKYGGDRPVLHFNYRTRFNDVWARPDLQERHGYTATLSQGRSVEHHAWRCFPPEEVRDPGFHQLSAR